MIYVIFRIATICYEKDLEPYANFIWHVIKNSSISCNNANSYRCENLNCTADGRICVSNANHA